jgi:hypothetical protein
MLKRIAGENQNTSKQVLEDSPMEIMEILEVFAQKIQDCHR